MKPHDTFLELAAVSIDFPLTPAERGRLEQHVAGCARCGRTVSALRGDALALASLPPVTLPERRAAAILDAALHPGAVRNPVRLVVVAALLGLLLIGSLAVGAELLRRMNHEDLSIVVPLPSLTSAPDASPAPSGYTGPSGTLAVTVVDPDGTMWVETMTLLPDGTMTKRLGQGRDPAWSADDGLFYTCLYAGSQAGTACTTDLQGGIQDLLVEAERPAPAPDGSAVAVHRGQIDVGETWLMAADGSNARRLAAGSFLQWSPDGVWLLGQPESASAEVAVVRADGSDGEPQVLATGYDPAWSPGGDRIAYVVVDEQGARVRVMTPFSDVSESRYTAPPGSELRSPEWLPDGRLLFVLDGDLYRLDGGSSEPVRLTTGLAIGADGSAEPLDVSADGQWIAFITGTGAEAEVGAASVHGGWKMIGVWDGAVTQARWAPGVVPSEPAPSATASAPGADVPLGDDWSQASVPVVAGRPSGRVEAVTAGGPGFVAVGRGCDAAGERCEGIVWTSADGRTWTRTPASDPTDTGFVVPMSGPEVGMFDVAAGGPGIVAIGYAARPALAATTWFSSDDGVSWERARLGDVGTTRVNAVTWDGRQFVVVGEDRSDWNGDGSKLGTATARAAVWTSPDGRTWTRVPHTAALDVGGFIDTLEDPATGGMRDVMASPNGLVAVGSVCSNEPVGCQPAAWTSVDGVAWERADGMPAVSGLLKAVAGSGTRFTAVGAGTCDSSPVAIPQPCPALVLTSPDGMTWTQQPFEQAGDLRALAVIGGHYFATAPDGPETLWTSDDGSAWVPADVQGGPATNGLDNFAEWHFAATPDTAVWLGTPPEADAPGAWVSGVR